MEVVIVKTGTANLASVVASFTRLGTKTRVSEKADDIETAARLVLPGVGSFAAAMKSLNSAGLVEALRKRFSDAEKSSLAICLGMQLLFEESEEDVGVVGIAAATGKIRRLIGDVRIPQMGWNEITPDAGCKTLRSGAAYFANSYCATSTPKEWRAAYCDYGQQFVAAMERGKALACQFHPELSGAWGTALIERWLKA